MTGRDRSFFSLSFQNSVIPWFFGGKHAYVSVYFLKNIKIVCSFFDKTAYVSMYSFEKLVCVFFQEGVDPYLILRSAFRGGLPEGQS